MPPRSAVRRWSACRRCRAARTGCPAARSPAFRPEGASGGNAAAAWRSLLARLNRALHLTFADGSHHRQTRMRIASRRRMLWRETMLALAMIGASLTAAAHNVPTYHGSADRGGNFVMPGFTWERARALRLDPAFRPRFWGDLFC